MPKKGYEKPKKPVKEKTDAQKWLDRINRAKKVKDKWRELFRIPMGYDYWEGRQRPSHIPEREWITINMIYSNLVVMLPSLYNMNPYFYMKLRRSFVPNPMMIVLYEQRGKIRQSMLNYLKEKLNLKAKTRLSIFDAMMQYGVIKVHHESEIIDNPDADKPLTDETGSMMVGEDGEPLKEPKKLTVSKAYKLTRIHPDDFLVDEDAGPLDDDVTWRAQRIKMKLADVKKDPRFKKSVRENITPTELSDEAQQQREQRKKGSVYESANENEQADIVVGWEIYNRPDDEWLMVAEGNDDFLIDPETVPKGIDKDPFIDLRLTLRDDSWYPLPPVSQWLDPQKEYCELRSKMVTHRKRFNRKYTVIKGLLENPDMDMTKLETGDDGTIIPVSAGAGGPVVYPIQDAALDQQYVQEIGIIQNELALLAVGPNQKQSGRGVDSATEASIIEQRLQIQEGDWIGLVVDFVTSIAQKLDMTVQVNLSGDQAIKVSGPQGEYWELVRAQDYEEIEGEYEYSVNVGATTPKLPEIERAQWIAFLNLIASAPQLAMSKRLLKHQAELHHIDDELMIDEIYELAKKMMSGAMPMPGQQGSVPGQGALPGTGTAGAAMGMANMRGGQ